MQLLAHPASLCLLALAHWKNAPKAKSLVASACHDCAGVGAHRQVEHAVGVAHQSGHFLGARIAPDVDLVLGVAVGAHQFMRAPAEGQVADLGASVSLAKQLSGEDVSHLHHSVSGASASCKEAVLVGRPRECFDCCSVIGKSIEQLSRWRPNCYFIVVSARCQHLLIERPLKSAYLLVVLGQSAEKLSPRPHVPQQNSLVARAGGQDSGIPGHGADSGFVAAEHAQLFHLDYVPKLHFSPAAANGKHEAVDCPRH